MRRWKVEKMNGTEGNRVVRDDGQCVAAMVGDETAIFIAALMNLCDPPSSSGRTPDFDSGKCGSNP